jgi:hypothetical protein
VSRCIACDKVLSTKEIQIDYELCAVCLDFNNQYRNDIIDEGLDYDDET